jgi:hypothetical protein
MILKGVQMKRRILWAALIVLTSVGFAQAQGNLTGTIAGVARTADTLPFPGVVVTAKSPALQGVRTTTTDANGNYIFKALPPGVYTITFQVSGMRSVEMTQTLELGNSINVNGTLETATVEESITVTGETPGILETPTGGANYKASEIDSLATGRTVAAMAELAPGLTDNTPNVGQVSISGAFAYDNVFLVDGVDVNDNLFGTANNLFIEDAIEEQQILTSAVSSEFGRFSGGVINTVTKRGGNTFQGSFRMNFINSAWTDESPYEKENDITREGETNKIYEGTLGGPIVKDKLWFFGAGRWAATSTQGTYPDLGEAVTSTQDNDRYIAKLTGTIAQNHTISGTYTRNSTAQSQPTFSITATSGLRSIDPRTFYSRTLPNNLLNINYNGVLSSNLFVEAQYSEKKFQFKDAGGTDTNLVNGSPILTQGVTGIPGAGHYNAPYFDATDPEDRNNRQIAASLSYFLSTGSLGRHDIKIGYENFRTRRTGGNSQSPTNYVFYADYATGADGKPALDGGRYVPLWLPETSARTLYVAERGAQLDITTQSFFINDKWQINGKFSANLGARLELVRSEATGDIVSVDTSTLVPRLALAYDVRGDGKIRLDASYARYAGKYNDTQIGNNTNVGNPAYVYQVYVGPEGQGLGFAPAFDPANYVNVFGGLPTLNIFVKEGLSSPTTDEWTLGLGFALPKNGFFKTIYTNRNMKNFIEDRKDTTTGFSVGDLEGVEVGPFDNRVFENSDLPTRKYQGLTFISNIRPTPRWNLAANYTLQLKNYGDFEGEARNQPGNPSTWLDYPELYVLERNFPLGRLSGFQRHKVRAWTSYDLGLGKVGSLVASIVYRYDSAQTYSLTAASVPFSAIQRARIAGLGYTSPPSSQTLFFDERGTEDFADLHTFDFAATYSVPLWKSLRPWVKFEVYNLLNNDKLVTWNTAISRNTTGPVDANGLATEYVKGANFGKGTGNGNYAVPRTIQFAVGFRF